jgi:hypothetical protein
MAVTTPRPEPAGQNRLIKPARRPGRFWSCLHFLIRFAGLTGFLAGCVGLVLAGLGGRLPSARAAFDDAWAALQGRPAVPSTWLILVGALAALFALLVEALVVAQRTAGRRSAFGFNALAQVGLAAALLVGVNVFSAANVRFSLFGRDFSWRGRYLRLDWTRSGQFTLPPRIRAQLEQLDPHNPTTVVVYQRHKTFGALTDKPDRYDYAAERKVVEKVKDLVAQFREVGPQFRVEVLDVEEEGYDEKLNNLTKDAPELRKAIEAAPENSIFVYSASAAGGRVQQLSFNEFYQLDKVASEQANGKRGNLVLLAQGSDGRGIKPFADKVLNLEERRPRVGVLVVHRLLTTKGSEDAFTLAGLRKVLAARGFEVRDVLLKKGWEGGDLQPAADTLAESELERLDADLEDLEGEVKVLDALVKARAELVGEWSLKPGEDEGKKLDRLSRKYTRELDGQLLSSKMRQRQLAIFQQELAQFGEVLANTRRERDRTRDERARLDVDDILESRRMTDLKAKLARALADCDLLLVPRLTRRSNGTLIPNRVHRLEEAQVAGIREFLRAGKPVLACFGPVNEPRDPRLPPDLAGPDSLEDLLGELGVRFGKQTVLFDADSKAFADRQVNPLLQDETVQVPPLDFDSPPPATVGGWLRREESAPPPANRLREALRVTAHSVGKGFDLRVRFPRPIYYEPVTEVRPAAIAAALGSLGAVPGWGSFPAAAGLLAGRRAPFDPTFLLTAPGAWNDPQPFPVRGRRPRYEPPKPDDPDNGTRDARRRGAFPIGVAVETALPPGWTDGPTKRVRLAVIGQGDVFVGSELSPARARLFLETANWLLGRDDYLPRGDHPWSYPRIDLPPGSEGQQLWLWGARLGLPALCAYLGLVVLLVRRLR